MVDAVAVGQGKTGQYAEHCSGAIPADPNWTVDSQGWLAASPQGRVYGVSRLGLRGSRSTVIA